MDIALLNTTITFQANAYETDEYGNHIGGWEDYFTCHATISGESGTESETTGVKTDHANCYFTVRWCKKTAAVEPTGYRIVMDGEGFDILSIDHMNNKRKALKFLCQKAGR